MSNLAHNGDDHPEAAAKHLDDAAVLLAATRYDGAGYLAGYVLECTFKTLIVIGEMAKVGGPGQPAALPAWLAAGGPSVSGALEAGMKEARKLKHDLGRLSKAAILLAAQPSAATAPYIPTLDGQSIYENGWTESLRYASPGSVGRTVSHAWVGEARKVYLASIARMRRDGVVF